MTLTRFSLGCHVQYGGAHIAHTERSLSYYRRAHRKPAGGAKRRPARHARPSSQHHSTVARSRTITRQTLGAPNGNAKHEEAAEEAAATTEAGTPEALQAQEPAPRRPPDPNAPNHERT